MSAPFEPNPPTLPKLLYPALTAVVLTVLFEKLGFFAITGNFIMFLNTRPMLWTYANASLLNLLSSALTYFSAIFFGILSDVCVAKYYVIAVAMLIFAIMTVLYPILYPYYGPYFVLPSNISCPDFWQEPFLKVFDTISEHIPFCKLGNDTDTERSLFSENCSTPILFDSVLMMLSAGAIEATLLPFGAELVYNCNIRPLFEI